MTDMVPSVALLPEQPKITLMCLTLSSFSVFGFFPVATENSVGLVHEEHNRETIPPKQKAFENSP